MKKGLLVAGSVFGVLIILMIAIPFLFKGVIAQKVKLAANEAINGRIDYSELDISLFQSFPRLNITLKNLSVTGNNESDTIKILTANLLSTSVNLSSLWSDKGFTINSIKLQHPALNLVLNKTGKSNRDILTDKPKQPGTSEKKKTVVNLEKIEIRDASITYVNERSAIFFSLRNGNFDITGAFKGNNSQLILEGLADSINLDSNGSRYISNLKFGIKGGLQSDFEKMSFTLLKNEFTLNKLPVEAQGDFVLGENGDNFEITFKSPSSSLADILGFIPVKYQKKLKGAETDGNIEFGGFVKGTYSATTFPGFGLNLKIQEGRIKYPNLPKEIQNIEVHANISKPQGDMDLTRIELEKFSASVAGNPITATLFVATPVSDPQLKGNLKGRIDFASLKQAIPMDSIDMKGIIDASADFDGQYSSIEKGQYEKFTTDGKITLKEFSLISKNLPQELAIKSADIGLNPKSISMTNLSGRFGESDFTVNGSMTNYWGYILKKGTLNGNIVLHSDYFNFNQLISNSNSKTTPKDSPGTGKPSELPENLNITIQSSVAKALYERMNITGISGKVILEERKVILEGLSMNMLKGKVLVSGTFATPREMVPDFDFKLDIKDFDLPTAYESSGTIRHFIPIAGQSTGSFNSGISMAGKIGTDNTPVFTSLTGGGNLSAKNMELVGAGFFYEIAKYFRKDLFRRVKINDFATNFKMVNGALTVSPFSTKIAGQDVTISGHQSASLSLDYKIDFKVNKEDLSEEVNSYIGFVPGAENIKKYPIGISLAGSFDKPDVKVDLTEARDLVAKEFTKKAGSAIQDALKKFGLDKLFK